MPTTRIVGVLTVVAALFSMPGNSSAQSETAISLAMAVTVECAFPLMAISSWSEGQPTAEVTSANLEMEFVSVNADEGTAQLASGIGAYDIIVRYAEGYLHFVQSFRNGPLYTTTVFERETTQGKLLAMHSRHEFTDYRLTGFTSSPEQYYGDCEVIE